MDTLTKRQEEILDFISNYIRDNLASPTIRDIARHFLWSSTNATSDHLKALVRKGYLYPSNGSSRGIRLTEKAIERAGLRFLAHTHEPYNITVTTNAVGPDGSIKLLHAGTVVYLKKE